MNLFRISSHVAHRLGRGLTAGCLLAVTAALSSCAGMGGSHQLRPILDKSIIEMQGDLDAGVTTSYALVQEYLARIEAIDRSGPRLHSVLSINPDVSMQARELDRERRTKGKRGPLHGIPVLLKDNIESADAMPTTAGSLALIDNVTGNDAPIVANLRAAGALVLGKTNLSEWANFRSEHSISGWSALGGLTRNPHVLDRTACGSSSGSAAATAATLAAGSVGTETDGSITCPASMNGIVGLKPTLGLLSGARIVPIAHSQDTAGPMTRTVSDAAVMLAAMVGSQQACQSRVRGCQTGDYVAALNSAALSAKRVGVLRFRPERNPHIAGVYERALSVLREAGATLIEVPMPDISRVSAAEETVLYTEFRADLNAYLANAPGAVKTRDLAQLIAFNRTNSRELSLFGQEIFEQSDGTRGLDDPKYQTALAESKRLAGPEGISRLLRDHQLDLLVAPTNGTPWRIDLVNGDHFSGSFSTLPAVSGYPHLTVPMGAVNDLPVGISFIGPPWSESLLLGAGFAYETRARARVAPAFKPSVEEGVAAMQPQPPQQVR